MPTSVLRLSRQESIFRPLAFRDFRVVLIGQFISSVGNSVYRLILPWTVYKLTGSTALMGLVLTANIVPQLVLMLIGGAIGDRFSRRVVVFTSDASACLVTAVVAVTAGMHALSPAELVVASFLLGVASSLFTPAYRAMNRDLVPVSHLQPSNALNSASANLARIAGPMAGALAFELGGAPLGFGLDAASFAVAVVAVFFTSRAQKKMTFKGTLSGDIKRGLKYMAATGWLRVVILLSLVANTFVLAPYYVLLPQVVRHAGGDAVILGFTMTAQTVTSTLSSLAVGKWGGKVSARKSFFFLSAMMGLGVLFVGSGARGVAFIVLGAIFVGVGFAFNVVEDIVIQRWVPQHYLSRVYGSATVASYSLLPVGYLLGGTLAQVIGAEWVLGGGGILLVAVSALGLLLVGERDFGIDGPAHLPEPEA